MNAPRLLMITAFVTPLATATAATRPYAVIAVGTPRDLPALGCRRPCEIVRPGFVRVYRPLTAPYRSGD
jgi:hypothetical protein